MKPYGLHAQEKIRSKKEFENVFKNGSTIFSSDNKIKAIYLFKENNNNCSVKFAVAVFKKAGNAVWRNRTKRLIRVSYRINKKNLTETCNRNNILLKVVFLTNTINQKNTKNLKLNDIRSAVAEIISKINKQLSTSLH